MVELNEIKAKGTIIWNLQRILLCYAMLMLLFHLQAWLDIYSRFTQPYKLHCVCQILKYVFLAVNNYCRVL